MTCISCSATLVVTQVQGDELLLWVQHGAQLALFRNAPANIEEWLTSLHKGRKSVGRL